MTTLFCSYLFVWLSLALLYPHHLILSYFLEVFGILCGVYVESMWSPGYKFKGESMLKNMVRTRCGLHVDSTWTVQALLHLVLILCGLCLESTWSPWSPHGVCLDTWLSVKYCPLWLSGRMAVSLKTSPGQHLPWQWVIGIMLLMQGIF